MNEKDINPFAALEESHSRTFREGEGHNKVQRGLDSTLGTARMLGSIADVYLNRYMGTIIGMASSNKGQIDSIGQEQGRIKTAPPKKKDKKYPNL